MTRGVPTGEAEAKNGAGGLDRGGDTGPNDMSMPLTPLGELRWRTYARVRGRVHSMRVQPWADTPALECVIVDHTGGILLVFLGRRRIGGLELGRRVLAEGMVGESRGYLAMLNPQVELIGE